MKSLPNFQQTVASFTKENHLDASAETRMLDLTSEVGELAKELLKGSAYGRQPLELSETWADELADAFFSLICLANATGVNLEVALASALEKYRQRLTTTGTTGSSR